MFGTTGRSARAVLTELRTALRLAEVRCSSGAPRARAEQLTRLTDLP